MFGSDILDIVIGMVFVFLLLSLVCSALKEFLEALVKNRARDLERGIRELVGDPQNTTSFVEKIYNHGLVNSLYKGCYSPNKTRNLPSYIPSANFALAVMDLVKNPPATGIKLPDNVKKAYDVYEKQAAGDAAKLQAGLEDWFNAGMDRVSGWYKRRAQWILVALGLVVAIALNADAVLIARTLSNDASLRKGLVAMAQARANQPSNPSLGQPSTGAPGLAAPAPAPAAALTAAAVSGPVPGATAAPVPAPTLALTAAALPAANPVALPADPPAAGQPAQTAAAGADQVHQADQVQQYVAELDRIGVPFGWQQRTAAPTAPPEKQPMRAVHATLGAIEDHSLGWILTAIAISMGAPFWFNLLGTIARSTTKPDAANSQSNAAA